MTFTYPSREVKTDSITITIVTGAVLVKV